MAQLFDDELLKKINQKTAQAVKPAAQYVQANYEQQQKQAAANDDIRAQYPVNVTYDKDAQYIDLINDAIARGDYAGAAQYEKQRNAKITGEGLDPSLYTDYYSQYLPENRYVYDPTKNAQYMAYQQQQDDIFQKIMNREPFSYDAESDPLYQQYKEQYTRLGQNAMRDTMGQAAALTGGYGSTYAQQAGQQSYDAYLARLNDVLPELYGDAYNRWQNEGNALLNQYNLAAGLADDAYQKDYQAWANRLSLEREDEANAYNRKLAAEQTAYQKQQDNRTYLLQIISATEYNPTDAELQAAGMTRAEANALKQEYERALDAASFSSGGGSGSSGRSSGGSSRRSSGGSNDGAVTLDNTEKTTKVDDPAKVQQCYKSLEQTHAYGGTKQQMREQIIRWYEEGIISDATMMAMYSKYGLNSSSGSKSSGGKGGSTGGSGNKNMTMGGY